MKNTVQVAPQEQPMMIEIARPEDAEAVVRIQKETWLATYPNEEHGITVEDILAKGLGSPERAERWRKTIAEQADQDHLWMAKQGGNVVGYCYAKKDAEEGKISALYVLPSAQGKGAGRKLMTEALTWLGTDKPISLGVVTFNAKAIAFYKSFGFHETTEPPEEIPPLPSGKRMPQLKMKRDRQG